MLIFNIEPIIKARGIERPYSFLVKAGLSTHSANSILNSTTRTMRLDHVELLCRILICEPGDLLVWTPDSGDNQLAENHPLHRLKAGEAVADLKETLSGLSYRELKEAAKKLTADNKNPG